MLIDGWMNKKMFTGRERERGFPSVPAVKNLPVMQEPQETWV